MPALSPSQLLSTTVDQAISGASNIVYARNTTSLTTQGLEVICAWPVSGQYGPGSRILYYVLIAACVLARKAEWIKNACLAAALLLPAVASLHAIVLAAFHQDGAVDLDIYGAFQLCAIGILAAPVTVRLSKTYFYDPGRNTIFVWAGLILAGLLSLTVEFYRVQPVLCTMDGQGDFLSPDAKDFPYDAQPACNMICTAETGPQSPMRGGAANNKYVIPAPNKFTFGTGTLLCAACCVHAVLWLASMMDKILEINWKSRFGITDDLLQETIEGTNGATVGRMYQVNQTVRFFMSVAVVPIIACAGLAVLIIGEINFFSEQMRYQNEPMASIGQWGPIVGTGLAIAGSLYLLLVADIEAVMHGPSPRGSGCACTCKHHHELQSQRQAHPNRAPSSRPLLLSKDREMADLARHQVNHDAEALYSTSDSPSSSMHDFDNTDARHSISGDGGGTLRRHTAKQSTASATKHDVSHSEGGSRHKVAATLVALGGALGSATQDSFDLSKFRDGAALDFPEIPGEKERNSKLAHIKEIYSKRLEEDGTPAVLASRSRASSFNGCGTSGHVFDNMRPSRDPSPQPGHFIARSSSPVPSSSRPRASTLPVEPGSQDFRPINTLPHNVDLTRGRQRRRRDTLEVPAAAHLRPHRDFSTSLSTQTVVSSSSTTDHQAHPLSTTTTITLGGFTEEPNALTAPNSPTRNVLNHQNSNTHE